MEVRSTETLEDTFKKIQADELQPALFKITMRKKRERKKDRDQNLIGLILEGLPLLQGWSNSPHF